MMQVEHITSRNGDSFMSAPRPGSEENHSLQIQSKDTTQIQSKDTTNVSIFSEFDLYLFGQGRHYHLYEKMGAHPRVVNGIRGINFAVWAPGARTISVIGDFNAWNRGSNPMQPRHRDLGVWECFIPHLELGTRYKYAIYSRYNNYT